MRTLDEMYDIPSTELTDAEYHTLCMAHGVTWQPGEPRAFAFIRPGWMEKAPSDYGDSRFWSRDQLGPFGLRLLCGVAGYE